MSRPGESAHPVCAKGVFDHAEKMENRKTPQKIMGIIERDNYEKDIDRMAKIY